MEPITRRSALTLAGAGALSALTACNDSSGGAADTSTSRSSAARAADRTPTTASSTGSSSAVASSTAAGETDTLSSRAVRRATTKDWVAFARTVHGPVDLPGSAAYSRTKQLFDTRYDGNRPAAVMVVERVTDVAKAMRFAAAHGLQVAPRSGGHSYVGASAANGTLVLDLRALTGVRYDGADKTVSVETGAGLHDVERALGARGRAIPTGSCPTVGIAGLALGGGLGVESRRQGLTADRLTAAEVVLPDGRMITVDKTHHPDVFWALRGGGGGLIGLVTQLRFATHAASPKGLFTLTFPGSAAVRVMTGWSRWIASTGRNRWAGVHVDAAGGGALHVSVVGVTSRGDERAAAASLAKAIGVDPSSANYQQLSYARTADYLGGGTTSARQGFTGGSDVLRTVDTAAARAIAAAVSRRSRSGGSASALLDPLTGAVSDPRAGNTAFPWRDHVASLQWYVGGEHYASADAWISSAHRDLAQYSSGSYVNYLEHGFTAGRYFAGNARRLARIRATYDPHRRMHCGLTV